MGILIAWFSVIFLILNIISSLIMSLFNLKTDVIGCGIFGAAFRQGLGEGERRNILSKVKTLGSYNVTRGPHSCGIFINGEVIKGVDKLKDFKDLIQQTLLPIPEEQNTIIIGHTRWATRGAHTAENAHPFEINSLVGAHNGVINNIDALCKKYNINNKDVAVDSKALYSIIEKKGFAEVLEEYEGFAALAWTERNKPGSMFLYHGEQLENKWSKKTEAERPLFILQTEEGVFFSSLENSLNAICEYDSEMVEELDTNTVFKITNGKFINWRKKINREGKIGNNVVVNNYGGGSTYYGGTTHHAQTPVKQIPATNVTRALPTSTIPLITTSLVYRESLPMRVYDNSMRDAVYSHRGRFYKYNHLLLNGIHALNDKGVLTILGNPGATEYYFWQGVMLKGEEAYNEIKKLLEVSTSFLNDDTQNFAANMSKYSKFPVTNLHWDSRDLPNAVKYRWYFDGGWAKEGFIPKWSGRFYKIKDGNLLEIKISNNQVDSPPVLETIEDVQKEIEFVSKNRIQGGKESLSMKKAAESIKEIIAEEENVSNCKTASCPSETKKDETYIPEFYEIIFNDYTEVMDVLGEPEVRALSDYIADQLDEGYAGEYAVTESEIRTEFNRILRKACNEKKTIEDCLIGKNKDRIGHYHIIALEKAGIYSGKKPIKDEEEDKTIDLAILENEEKYYTDKWEECEPVNDEMTEEQEMEINAVSQTAEIVEDIVDTIEELDRKADEISASNSDFAVDVNEAVTKGIKSMVNSLATLCDEYGQSNLVTKINKILSHNI